MTASEAAAHREDWEYRGEVGVDAATVALWDRDVFPVSHRFEFDGPAPSAPHAVISVVGDDIDGGIETSGDEDVTRVRLVFVDDVDELEQSWRSVGELHLPGGHLVLADPYCSPIERYRQEFDVRPGWWSVEELHWEGDLEAVRITWVRGSNSGQPWETSSSTGTGRTAHSS